MRYEGSFLRASPFPSTEPSCYRGQVHGGGHRGFLLFMPGRAGGCHAGTGKSQGMAMLQLRMPSSTLTLTEPAHPTPHCRTFIILGLFYGFEGFSVTEGHERSTHTHMPGHTKLYPQSCKVHMRMHTQAHIHVHTQSCTSAHASIHIVTYTRAQQPHT